MHCTASVGKPDLVGVEAGVVIRGSHNLSTAKHCGFVMMLLKQWETMTGYDLINQFLVRIQ